MSTRRAFVLPLHTTSLLLVAFLTVVTSLFGSLGESVSPGGLLVSYLMLSWLNKYGFALMDHAAHGRPGAPVASVEMLGPFGDPRVFIHPTLALAIGLAAWRLHLPALPVAIVLLCVLPASLAGLAMSGNLIDAVHPRALGHAIRGLGLRYLLPLGLVAALLLLWLTRTAIGLPRAVFVLLHGLLSLWLYAVIGGAIHARRLQLDFEPALSPERAETRRDDARAAALQATLDAVYASTQAGNFTEGRRRLASHLVEAAARGQLPADGDQILRQLAPWPKDLAVAAVVDTLVHVCLEQREFALALRAAELALNRMPTFSLKLEADRAILAEYARHTSRPTLARRLLETPKAT